MKTKTIYLLIDGIDPVISFERKDKATSHAFKNGLTIK